jgi:RHS repeat-associated protein
MTNRILRRALACALLTSTALASPALAQTVTYEATERQAPDENGVDVITGKVTVPLRSVVVGSGDSTLGYALGYAEGEYADTFRVSIAGLQGEISDPVKIYIFGDVKRFTSNGDGTWSNADGDGGTFVYDASFDGYIYTARDGTVFKFLRSLKDTGFLSKQAARVSTITRPTGEVWTYMWKLKAGVSGVEPSPAAGRVQSVTSSLGYQLKPTYASNFTSSADWTRLTKVTALNNSVEYCDPLADSCTFANAWPEVTISQTVSGSVTTRSYTDRLSNTTQVSSISAGITGVTLPGNASAAQTLTYDANSRVATLSKGGGTWGYTYADSGTQRTTTVTQPGGGSKVYVSDLSIKRVLSISDELSRTTSFTYDTLGRLTRTTSPEGDYVQRTYDARGNVTEQRHVAKAGSGAADIVTSAAFPSSCTNIRTCNQPSSSTDARGNVTDYSYDATHGGLLTVTAPAPSSGAVRPQIRYTYAAKTAYYKNSAGAIVAAPAAIYKLTAVSQCQTLNSCAGAADEVKTTLDYGTSGVANTLLLKSVSSGSGNGALTATTSATYDNAGNVTTVDGPLAGSADTTTYFYDGTRRLTKVASPDPDGAGALPHRAVQYTYNANGNVTRLARGSMTQSGGTWSAVAASETLNATYDNIGRPTKQTLTTTAGTTTITHALRQFRYDSKGRLECTALRMNSAAFASPPSSACTLGTSGSAGPDRIAKNSYNTADELVEVREAYGVTGAEAPERTLTYTTNGNVATVKDGENNLTTYEYDGHDRLAKTRFPVGTKAANASSTTDYEQLTYDAGSNVTSRRLRDANSIGYTYDALNRATFKNLPGTEPDVTYAYDNLGRLTSATQTGSSLSFTYDALSRNLTQVGAQGTVASQWDVAGRRTRLTYPGSGLYVDYDYLVTGDLTAIRENGATSGIGVLASFGYDSLGRRTSLTFGNGTSQGYGYDPVSRLASLSSDLAGTTHDLTSTFSFNPASQIASTSRNNDAYAWTDHSNISNGYTANGLNQYSAAGAATLTYDAKGNLTSDGSVNFTFDSENKLISASGAKSATLAYDPLNRLRQVVDPGKTSRFMYDGLDAIAEYNASNGLRRRFVFGPRVDEPLVQYEGTGLTDRRFLHADERGSVVARSDSTGAMFAISAYDEYGNIQSSNVGRFQYTGQMWLDPLGLHHYKGRVYSPKLGRFLQPDPIGYADGLNHYAYVGNDPVNRLDPLGLETIIVTGSYASDTLSGAGVMASALMALIGPMMVPQLARGEGDGGDDEIVVTGRRRQPQAPPPLTSMFHLAAAPYEGPSFCSNATKGAPNLWNPLGRINSNKEGDFDTALSDLDSIADANNMPRLGDIGAGQVAVAQLGASWFPIPAGNGWWATKNYMSGDVSISRRGLTLRLNAAQNKINIDIPRGYRLPDGQRLNMNETCHYRG